MRVFVENILHLMTENFVGSFLLLSQASCLWACRNKKLEELHNSGNCHSLLPSLIYW